MSAPIPNVCVCVCVFGHDSHHDTNSLTGGAHCTEGMEGEGKKELEQDDKRRNSNLSLHAFLISPGVLLPAFLSPPQHEDMSAC